MVNFTVNFIAKCTAKFTIKLIITFSILIFLPFVTIAGELPALNRLQVQQQSEMYQDRFSYAYEPFKDLFTDQKHFVDQSYTVFNFKYTLESGKVDSLSYDFNREISALLNSIFATPTGKTMLQTLLNTPLKQLKFSLFFSNQIKPIDSWTDADLNTYIFIGSEKVSRTRLLRILIHEIAQKTLNKGFSVRAAPELLNNQQVTNQQICSSTTLFSRPDIALIFNTLSAFSVEEKVLSELQIISSPGLRMSCWQQFEKTLSFVEHYKNVIKESMSDWLRSSPLPCHQESLTTNLLDYFKSVEGESLCKQLKLPIFSEKIQHKGSFGPRPNVGNGGGFD